METDTVLENTYWGWHGTAWTMCMFAIICDPRHDPVCYEGMEKRVWHSLAVGSYIMAIIFAVIGATRYFRQQQALTQGMVIIGGIEVYVVCVVVIAAVVAVMVMVARYGSEGDDGTCPIELVR